jgi:hypothetical protein
LAARLVFLLQLGFKFSDPALEVYALGQFFDECTPALQAALPYDPRAANPHVFATVDAPAVRAVLDRRVKSDGLPLR